MPYNPATDRRLDEDQRAFIGAIMKDDIDRIQSLLDNGVSPDTINNGCGEIIPIHIAVARGNVEIAALLVNHGAKFQCDLMTENELHIASARDDIKMLEFLVQKYEEDGFGVRFGQPGDETPLHSAMEAGSLDCVQLLVRHGADIHARNHWNWTPLFCGAAVPNAVSSLDFLVNSGADVNATDSRGTLPIWQAALHDNLEGVRLLASQTSNLDKRNINGETILHAAAYGGSLEMVQFLVAAGVDITAKSASNSSVLHRAAEAGNTEIIKWLFDTHATNFGVNDTTSFGWTPILFATYRNRTSTIKALLKHGADVGISPLLGCSPLHFIAGYRCETNIELPFNEAVEKEQSESDNPAMINLLIQHGADVVGPATQQVDLMQGQGDGESLQRNVHAQKEELQCQPEHQPTTTTTTVPGRSFLPIHYAAGVGNLEKVKALLDHSNDDSTVNAQNPWGATPLHGAASCEHLDILQFLISRGGDMNVRTAKGHTVLQYLGYYNSPDTARKFLIKCGVYDPSVEKDLDVNELKRAFRSRTLGI